MKCEHDGTEMRQIAKRLHTCPSCDLYNAAITAINAAAAEIARDFNPRAKDAWLNEHGVFADIDGIKRQVGTPAQAAPFVALTGVAREVKDFWREPETDTKGHER